MKLRKLLNVAKRALANFDKLKESITSCDMRVFSMCKESSRARLKPLHVWFLTEWLSCAVRKTINFFLVN